MNRLPLVCGASREIQKLWLFNLQIGEKTHSSHGSFGIIWMTLGPAIPLINDGRFRVSSSVDRRHLGAPSFPLFPVAPSKYRAKDQAVELLPNLRAGPALSNGAFAL